MKRRYYSKETENPDLRKDPCGHNREDLADVIDAVLSPIRDFLCFTDDSLMDKKTQRDKDMLSILFVLLKNAENALNRFGDDMAEHLGQVTILKNKGAEKAAGVEIRRESKDQELYSYLAKNHEVRENLHRFIRTHGIDQLAEATP